MRIFYFGIGLLVGGLIGARLSPGNHPSVKAVENYYHEDYIDENSGYMYYAVKNDFSLKPIIYIVIKSPSDGGLIYIPESVLKSSMNELEHIKSGMKSGARLWIANSGALSWEFIHPLHGFGK